MSKVVDAGNYPTKTSSNRRQVARKLLKINHKELKLPDIKRHDALVIRGTAMKNAMVKLKKFSQDVNNYSKTAEDAATKWAAFIRTNNLLKEFRMDEAGIRKRDEAFSAGFRNTGGRGKMSPYIVSNGILRGGPTGKVAEAGGWALIPSSQENRELTSLNAKYVNPKMFPSARIIKYIRGGWGNPLKVNSFEQISYPGMIKSEY